MPWGSAQRLRPLAGLPLDAAPTWPRGGAGRCLRRLAPACPMNTTRRPVATIAATRLSSCASGNPSTAPRRVGRIGRNAPCTAAPGRNPPREAAPGVSGVGIAAKSEPQAKPKPRSPAPHLGAALIARIYEGFPLLVCPHCAVAYSAHAGTRSPSPWNEGHRQHQWCAGQKPANVTSRSYKRDSWCLLTQIRGN